MKFARDSRDTDRCWFCRRPCGEVVVGRVFDKRFLGHGRYAVWVPALGRHIEASAHDACFYDHGEGGGDGR